MVVERDRVVVLAVVRVVEERRGLVVMEAVEEAARRARAVVMRVSMLRGRVRAFAGLSKRVVRSVGVVQPWRVLS